MTRIRSIALFYLLIIYWSALNSSEAYRRPFVSSNSVRLKSLKNHSVNLHSKKAIWNTQIGVEDQFLKKSSFLADHRSMYSGEVFIASDLHQQEAKETIERSPRPFLQNFPWKKVVLGTLGCLIALFGKKTAAFALSENGLKINSLLSNWNMADSGFLQSFLLIFVSEIGDKTFFIAALLAAKYGRLISFAGSIGALAVMTIISTVIGQLFHAVPSSISKGIPFDDYIAVAAFAYFGVKTLLEASKLDPADKSGIEEEKAEAEELVNEVASKTISSNNKASTVVNLILQTFSLVFAAEIGDRSFLSTIALSAALNPFAVGFGAIAAHAFATGVAVLGGAFMSKYLSERVIGYIGGTLFIVFAITTALGLF